jgi:hypothetical protein
VLSQSSCESAVGNSSESAVGLSQSSCESAADQSSWLSTTGIQPFGSTKSFFGTDALTAECGSVLTHVDSEGRANMVDVGHKRDTERVALASGSIFLGGRVFFFFILIPQINI